MNSLHAGLIVVVALIASMTMLGGCYMVNVVPLKDHCAQWRGNESGGSYVLVPCK